MMVLSEKDLCGLQSPVGAVLSQKCAGEVRLGQSPEPFVTDSQSRSRVFRGFGVGGEIGRLPTTRIL